MSEPWSDRIKKLCERIVREKDSDKLGDLAVELDQLIAEEQERRKKHGTLKVPTKN